MGQASSRKHSMTREERYPPKDYSAWVEMKAGAQEPEGLWEALLRFIHRVRSKWNPHQGVRERARRRMQFEEEKQSLEWRA